MADKSIEQLITAESVLPTDLFVLQQSNMAKKLTGQVLLNWLTAAADGHGGIKSIEKISTNGLVDTYRITLADTTTFDFVVTNGRSVNTIEKVGTADLVDTYQINYNDGTTGTFNVTNGAKGDKGDNTYIWIKYASQRPTVYSHSFGDVADDWIGIYYGPSATAPTDWQQYEWFQIKGEKGDPGVPATLVNSVTDYQASDSGTVIPSGTWLSSVPVVAQGKYLWTRTTNTFNTGAPAVSHSVSRMGLDGSGSVASVANVSPDENGNVPLTAGDVGALPNTGGDVTGELRMNGQPIKGLNAPTENDQAANMGFVNQQVKKAAPRNLLDNSDFEIAQAGYGGKHGDGEDYALYAADRWVQNDKTERSYSKTTHNGHGALKCTTDTRINQNLYLIEGEVYTASVIIGNNKSIKTFTANKGSYGVGNLWVNYQSSGHYQFVIADIPANTVVSEPVLYHGEYTIDTLPEYQPKEDAVELLTCRKFARISENKLYGYATSTAAYVDVILETPMRVIPSIATITSKGAVTAGGKELTVTGLTVTRSNENSVSVMASYAADSTVSGQFACLNDANFLLSADL